jgi:hypothetical protein
MLGASLHLVYWLAPSTVLAAVAQGLRRRNIEDMSVPAKVPGLPVLQRRVTLFHALVMPSLLTDVSENTYLL